MWLSWDAAALLAAALAATRLLLRRRPSAGRFGDGVAAFAGEAALVAGLYSLWQGIAALTDRQVTGGIAHGEDLLSWERALHLPGEAAVQKLFLHHPLWVQAANGYYAVAHVPALGVFLLWAWFRHRDGYRRWRNILVVVTFASFVAHLVPVAPPRMLPGFVDTGLLYHQSVYGPMGTGISDQLAALPSLHMAWALIVAAGVVTLGATPKRWWSTAHPALTLLVIVVTGNHYWLDAVAAVLLLAGAAAVVDGAERLRRRLSGPRAEVSVAAGLR